MYQYIGLLVKNFCCYGSSSILLVANLYDIDDYYYV